MFRPTIALCLPLLFFLIGSTLHAAEVDDLFQSGLKAYQAHKFEDARDHFQKALTIEPDNARLAHNLALSFYQLNQKPLAVALWRKALTLDPNYRAARAGRDLMESRMNMRAFERDPLNLWIERALESISPIETALAFILAIGACGYLWIQYLARRSQALAEQAPAPPLPSLAGCASVLFIAVAIVAGLKVSSELTPRATIVGDKVNAKSLPTEEGVALFEIPGGTEVLVRNQQPGWRQIENPEGSTGWIKDADLLANKN